MNDLKECKWKVFNGGLIEAFPLMPLRKGERKLTYVGMLIVTTLQDIENGLYLYTACWLLLGVGSQDGGCNGERTF